MLSRNNKEIDMILLSLASPPVAHALWKHPRHSVHQGLWHGVQVGAWDEGVVVEHLVTQHHGQAGHQDDGHHSHLYTCYNAVFKIDNSNLLYILTKIICLGHFE